MASDSLMASLLQIAKDESVPIAVRLAAIRDGLDRAGLTARTEVDVDVKVSVWEQNAAEIIQVVSETVKVGADDAETSDIVDAEVVDPHEWQAEVDASIARDNADRRRAKKGLPPAPVSMTPPTGPRPSSVPDYGTPEPTDLPTPPPRTAKQRKADATADAANRAVEARATRETRTLRRRRPKPR